MATVKKALTRAAFSLMLSDETGQITCGYVSMRDLYFINFLVLFGFTRMCMGINKGMVTLKSQHLFATSHMLFLAVIGIVN